MEGGDPGVVMGEKKTYKVPAIIRGLDILEFLGNHQDAPFTEIYTALGIPKSSAYQILSTLETRGYVRRTGDGTRYGLGLRLFELGNLAVSCVNIRAEALPVLRELMMKTNQTCHIGILDGNEGVYLAKVESSQAIRLYSWEGKRIPLHSSSMGKVLLASQDEETIEKILKEAVLTRNTEHTITAPEELKRHLRVVREQGWALDDQENEPNVRGVGAPVIDITGKVIAAISVSGLNTQINDEVLPDVLEQVRDAAWRLSVKMGSGLKKA